jgi:hypothetical protein
MCYHDDTVFSLKCALMEFNMKKIQTVNLEIRCGRLVPDEHGVSIDHEKVLPPLAGSERAVRASVVNTLQEVSVAQALKEAAVLKELEAANTLNEPAPARRVRHRRRTKPRSADV